MNKRKWLPLLLLVLCLSLLPGCVVEPWTFNMAGIPLSEVQASYADAYYLSKSGQLYCAGADTDSIGFVVYKDRKTGLVADNVQSFHLVTSGGSYIDDRHDLYVWNKYDLSLYNYKGESPCQKVLSGVRFAIADYQYIVYIDLDNHLYCAGTWGDEHYPLQTPKQLDEDVVAVTIMGNAAVWSTADGMIHHFGDTQNFDLEPIENRTWNQAVQQIMGDGDHRKGYFYVLLSGNDLWFYGDYQRFISGEETGTMELRMLRSNVQDVSACDRGLLTLDVDGTVTYWGRNSWIYGDAVDPDALAYYEAYPVAKNAVAIYLSAGYLCYVDSAHRSNIFYEGSMHGFFSQHNFYGNTTDANCIRLDQEPARWVEKD